LPKILQDQNSPRYFKKKPKILARFLQESPTCIILKDLAQDCCLGNANTTMDSCSYLGGCYKHPQYPEGTNEAKTFLAGSFKFQLDEIEVIQKK
jgi:hypothetical protein